MSRVGSLCPTMIVPSSNGILLLICFSLSLSILTATFPGEPGLASSIAAKDDV